MIIVQVHNMRKAILVIDVVRVLVVGPEGTLCKIDQV